MVLVNFWASWCPPCREEMPAFEKAWQAYKDRGVVIIGVDIQDSEPDAISFLQETGVTYPSGSDRTGAITIDYRVSGLPTTFFVTRSGNIFKKWIGPLDDERLASFIEDTLNTH